MWRTRPAGLEPWTALWEPRAQLGRRCVCSRRCRFRRASRPSAAIVRAALGRWLRTTHEYPTFIRDGREVATAASESDGGLNGTGWTSGTITATARVVNRLGEVDR